MMTGHQLIAWVTRHVTLSTAVLVLIGTTLLLIVHKEHVGPVVRRVSNLFPVRSQKEIAMIRDIRDNYMHPPSSLPYKLKDNVNKDPSRGQSEAILKALGHMRDGFFVECGALDGETRSNTLFMERFLGWTGLLVEADPANFAQVVSKQRNAWSANVCLNNRHDKSRVRFKPAFNVGKIAGTSSPERGTVPVDCFPLHALLLALNRTRVDYFSLDVEGAELDVLETVPFDRIDIRTLSVEFAHTTGGGKPALRSFMERRGYTVIGEVRQADWTANDFILVKNTSFPELVSQVALDKTDRPAA